MLTNIQRVSLQVITLNPGCKHVQSTSGIPVNVSGVVHFKITSTREFLPLAAEQFLGKTTEQIKQVVMHIVEGHMRAVIGSQEINHICKERQTFASLIREAASADLTRMGINVLSLTIKDIKDDSEYLSSAGKQATASAKKEAAIASTEAENAAAEAKFESTKQELQAENDFALAKLRHQMEEAVASLESQVGKAKAESGWAYDLELARQQKQIKSKEMKVRELELRNLLELQRLEGERRRLELVMEVELSTGSEIYELTKQTVSIEARIKCELEAEEYRIKREELYRLLNSTPAVGHSFTVWQHAATLADTWTNFCPLQIAMCLGKNGFAEAEIDTRAPIMALQENQLSRIHNPGARPIQIRAKITCKSRSKIVHPAATNFRPQ